MAEWLAMKKPRHTSHCCLTQLSTIQALLKIVLIKFFFADLRKSFKVQGATSNTDKTIIKTNAPL